jgi:branched-chain amino acid aminotransferase
MWIYLNGRFVDRKEALISVFDHGFLYGDGIYETLRAYDGRIFMLRKHLARLRRSADLIGLQLPISETDWPRVLEDAMRRNDLTDAYLRITVSRGEGEIGLDPGLCPQRTVVVMAKPPMSYPQRLYEEGVTLAVVSVRRNLSTALSPRIKSLNFLNNILTKREATSAQAFDGIMLNADGDLTECSASNVFFVRDGRLCTPSLDCGILDGVTRDIVLVLAREHNFHVEEDHYRVEDLLGADECFLTNTSMELMPVRTVNNTSIGPGRPGAVTRQLADLFRQNLPRFLEPSIT